MFKSIVKKTTRIVLPHNRVFFGGASQHHGVDSHHGHDAHHGHVY